MVTFNELRISDERDCLIIDCEMEQVDVFKEMYIQSIWLEYYKNANPAGAPGDNTVCVWNNDNDDNKIRSLRKYYRLSNTDASVMGVNSFDNGLFYVIVVCEGEPGYQISNMPCGSDDPYNWGAILDWRTFYVKGMQYVNTLARGCNLCPDLTGFEHYAVIWNALKMALSTCDWNLVSDLWDKFILAPSSQMFSGSHSSGCGCR